MAGPGGTKITGGSLKGETVKVLPGMTVRPMRSRVREALFSIIGPEIERAKVLDLYAGSGALGAESISRGATRVIFAEKDPRVLRILHENRKLLGLSAQTEVQIIDLDLEVPRCKEPYDIALCDPPFPNYEEPRESDQNPWRVIDRVVSECLAIGGRVVIEHPKGEHPPESSVIEWRKARPYGTSAIRWGRKIAAAVEDAESAAAQE